MSSFFWNSTYGVLIFVRVAAVRQQTVASLLDKGADWLDPLQQFSPPTKLLGTCQACQALLDKAYHQAGCLLTGCQLPTHSHVHLPNMPEPKVLRPLLWACYLKHRFLTSLSVACYQMIERWCEYTSPSDSTCVTTEDFSLLVVNVEEDADTYQSEYLKIFLCAVVWA